MCKMCFLNNWRPLEERKVAPGFLLQIDIVHAVFSQHKGVEDWKVKDVKVLVYCYIWGSDILQELWLFLLAASRSDLYLYFFLLFRRSHCVYFQPRNGICWFISRTQSFHQLATLSKRWVSSIWTQWRPLIEYKFLDCSLAWIFVALIKGPASLLLPFQPVQARAWLIFFNVFYSCIAWDPQKPPFTVCFISNGIIT